MCNCKGTFQFGLAVQCQGHGETTMHIVSRWRRLAAAPPCMWSMRRAPSASSCAFHVATPKRVHSARPQNATPRAHITYVYAACRMPHPEIQACDANTVHRSAYTLHSLQWFAKFRANFLTTFLHFLSMLFFWKSIYFLCDSVL